MKECRSILFVSHGTESEHEVATLQQAIQLAHANQASLDILIIGPPLTKALEQYKAPFEAFLTGNINKTIEAAKSGLPASHTKRHMDIEIDWEDAPSIKIIQRIIHKSHDLLIKAAENDENTKGFKALDMDLLSKCPCTLFLHRPFKHKKQVHIAVAIDPDTRELARKELSVQLLQLTQHLAAYYKTPFGIISCWDYLLEKFLRSSVWMEMPEEEIEQTIQQENDTSYQAVTNLLKTAGINSKAAIYHVKGDPTELIPEFIIREGIDILVMGTVARTGISGFIIGNTAENILQKVDCSLWAIKPRGFVSPVKG